MVIPVSPEYRYFAPNHYLERRQPEWASAECSADIVYVFDDDPRTNHPAMVRVSAMLDDVIERTRRRNELTSSEGRHR
jgi:hypothetical protein